MSARRSAALSPPEMFLLDAWGHSLRAAFGATPYLVGSAMYGKEWRDVDVRMMLADDEWERLIGKGTLDMHPRRVLAPWAILCTAISVWGQQFTGLPIDFQFQTIAEGNDDPYNHDADGNVKLRSALAIGFYDLNRDVDCEMVRTGRCTQEGCFYPTSGCYLAALKESKPDDYPFGHQV